jgi:MoCo/4Fe-4S cofactor protein with predicted Tat translocation signal
MKRTDPNIPDLGSSPLLRIWQTGLANTGSAKFWRSLEERADTDEFRDWLHREFPAGASEWDSGLDRRHFLRIMGAAFALLGLGSCSRPPQQKIVSYVEVPEEVVPGQHRYFATAMPLNGIGTGILVESNDGRPTKVEGNPSHPMSLGATSAFEQASILQLYDPDRSRTVVHNGQIETWETLLADLRSELDRHRQNWGARLRLLTGPVSSPSLRWQLSDLQRAFPAMKQHQWDPLSQSAIVEGCRIAFNQPAYPEYRLQVADTIVALDSDFLFELPERLTLTKAFTNRRRFEQLIASEPNQLFVAEATLSITGSMADNRLPVPAREIGNLILALATRLGLTEPFAESLGESVKRWLDRVVEELKRKPAGACL